MDYKLNSFVASMVEMTGGNPGYKVCRKCGQTKPVALFSRNKRRSDGIDSMCYDCNRRRGQLYYEANKEKVNSKNKQWQTQNPERFKAYQHQWGQDNRIHKAEYNKKWRQENLEQAKRQAQDYYLDNREAILENNRRWQRENPEAYAAYQKRWRRLNRIKTCAYSRNYRARAASAPGIFTSEHVKAKLELQGGLCYYCKAPLENYHIEHKIPLARGGSNWPANICCACPTCNVRKSDTPFWEFMGGPYLGGRPDN